MCIDTYPYSQVTYTHACTHTHTTHTQFYIVHCTLQGKSLSISDIHIGVKTTEKYHYTRCMYVVCMCVCMCCIYPNKNRVHINAWARINAGVQHSKINRRLYKMRKGPI